MASGENSKKNEDILGTEYMPPVLNSIKEEVTLEQSEKDRTAPEDFYVTTNHQTEIYFKGKWLLVQKQRMDGLIVLREGEAQAECTLLRNIKKGDKIVCGDKGVKVTSELKEKSHGFSFMENQVSSERRTELSVKRLAEIMKSLKQSGKKIVFVAGPIVIHTGAAESLASLIRNGYVNGLLANNAIAVHDIEQAIYNTALGIRADTGEQGDHGHRNHMAAINQVNCWGSIEKGVEQGLLKRGVMYECIKSKTPFALAGSIRDDGPLPDTITDMILAQEEYAKILEGTELVIMLSTMLHSIGAGNMIPSRVKTVCIDINPAVATKLSDRGSSQAIGIVTDVGLFLRLLERELCTL